MCVLVLRKGRKSNGALDENFLVSGLQKCISYATQKKLELRFVSSLTELANDCISKDEISKNTGKQSKWMLPVALTHISGKIGQTTQN